MASNYFPMVSSSPPPLDDEPSIDDDDEFGNFTCATTFAVVEDLSSSFNHERKRDVTAESCVKSCVVNGTTCPSHSDIYHEDYDAVKNSGGEVVIPTTVVELHVLNDSVPIFKNDDVTSLDEATDSTDLKTLLKSGLPVESSGVDHQEGDVQINYTDSVDGVGGQSSFGLEKCPENAHFTSLSHAEVETSNIVVQNDGNVAISTEDLATNSEPATVCNFSHSPSYSEVSNSLTDFTSNQGIKLPTSSLDFNEGRLDVPVGDVVEMLTNLEFSTSPELVICNSHIIDNVPDHYVKNDECFDEFICCQPLPSATGPVVMIAKSTAIGMIDHANEIVEHNSQKVICESNTCDFYFNKSKNLDPNGVGIVMSPEDYSSDFPDFADFQTAQPSDVSDIPQEPFVEQWDCEPSSTFEPDADSGDEFGCFSAFADKWNDLPFGELKSSSCLTNTVDDDEFGNFDSAPLSIQPTEANALGTSVASKVLTLAFPGVFDISPTVDSVNLEEALSRPPLTNDSKTAMSIWSKLRDIDNTNALSYHWSSSQAKKKMLHSLRISTCSLLAGSRWNSSFPIFAANLGIDPLEPTKAPMQVNSEEKTTICGIETSGIACTQESTIPPAQFDWSSSGLVNPLDDSTSALLDLDFFLTNDVYSSIASSKTTSLETEFLGAASTVKDHLQSSNSHRMLSPLLNKILTEAAKSSASTYSMNRHHRCPIMSSEARQILDSLPDLSFMRAKVLMFPIRSVIP